MSCGRIHDEMRLSDQCNDMEPGQILTIHKRKFFDEYGHNPITGESAMQSFKGQLIGYNFGPFSIEEDPLRPELLIVYRDECQEQSWSTPDKC